MAQLTDDDTSDELIKHLWGRRYETLCHLRMSVLYHLKRERFFEAIDRSCSMLTAAAATAAVGIILRAASGRAELIAAAMTALLSLVPLVFNPAGQARKHGQSAAEFRRLQAECEHAGERWTEATCDRFAGRVVELEATEPAPLSALVIDCQNQINAASGKPEDIVALRWYERLFKNWWDFDIGRIAARRQVGDST